MFKIGFLKIKLICFSKSNFSFDVTFFKSNFSFDVNPLKSN